MKITYSDEHKLVIVDRSYVLFGIGALLTIVFVLGLVRAAVRGETQTREWLGNLLGLLVSASLAYYTGKRSTFTFDLDRRELVWSRRELFRTKGGVVPFDQITAVTVESTYGGETASSLMYRVVLKTSQGTVPLSEGYGGGEEEKYEAIRTTICNALNRDPSVQRDNDILELAAAGRQIDAIRLAAERYKLDLEEAKRFVDGLPQGANAITPNPRPAPQSG